MRIIFLTSSDEDVRWFVRYYRAVFREGAGNARKRMATSLAILAGNPRIGPPTGEEDLRQFRVSRTPFSLVYRVAEDRIEILRLRDGRANPELLNEQDQGPE